MEVILGLGAAIAYGAGDFAGGLVSRRANVLIVVALSQVIGSTILIPAIIVVGGELTTSAMGWGAVSGIAGGVGVILLYTGLSRGRMSVVAPITAVLAAIVPVGFGLVTGERPSPLALIGVVIALGSVGLVSAAPDPRPEVGPEPMTRISGSSLPQGSQKRWERAWASVSSSWPWLKPDRARACIRSSSPASDPCSS